MKASSVIIVNLSLDNAFSYYSDQERLQEWIPGGAILEFTPLMPPPKGPGSQYRMAYRLMGVTFRSIAELTKLERNRRSEMKQVTGDFKAFHYEMTFAAATPVTTSLKMTIKGQLPWGILGVLAGLIARSQLRCEIGSVLQRFKTNAEAFSATLVGINTSADN